LVCDYEFLPCSIEFVNSRLGVPLVGHGDKGVALLGDVDIGDSADLGELVLQDVLRAGTVDAIDEKFCAA